MNRYTDARAMSEAEITAMNLRNASGMQNAHGSPEWQFRNIGNALNVPWYNGPVVEYKPIISETLFVRALRWFFRTVK